MCVQYKITLHSETWKISIRRLTNKAVATHQMCVTINCILILKYKDMILNALANDRENAKEKVC